MGTPMLRGLPSADGDNDDGSLGATEQQTKESRNVIAPVAIVLVAIVAVGAGFIYVTPNSALSALTEEPEEPSARTTVFDGLDRLRELGVITDEDGAQSASHERTAYHGPGARANESASPPRVRISAPPRSRRTPELNARMARLHEQLAEAKRRMNSMGDARDSSRSRPADVSGARVSTSSSSKPASRAQDESIKRSYGPFTRPGFFAFAGAERHASPRPVSYGALRREGIATDYNKFLQAMTGSGLYRKNDRPPFYPIPATDQERRQMTELFDEFNSLAPIWVQMGILRP